MSLFRFKSKGKIRQLVDLVYPVGSIYISTASTNPGTLFGGTWEAFAPGRVLIGAGQGNDGTTSMSFTANSTGGKYKHQHDYGLQFREYYGLIGSKILVQNGDDWANPTNAGYQVSETFSKTSHEKETTNADVYVSYGKTKIADNIIPYFSVYMWKRIS